MLQALKAPFVSYMSFIDKICSKTCFSRIYSIKAEQKKIALIRILFGLMVLVRSYQILESLIVLGERWSSRNFTFALACCALAVVIGFLTPVSIAVVTFGISILDLKLSTSTLASNLVSMLGIVLLLTNSGEYYSLDGLVLRSRKKIKMVWEFIYSPFAIQSEKDLSRAYFLGFSLYAVISFTAMIFHVNDSVWLRGLTLKALLTNSYLCNFYGFFRAFNEQFPNFFYFLSISGAFAQTIFQMMMLPLAFSKFGSWFVYLWGMIFFVISLLFINLAILPHIEILMWTLLFVKIKPRSQKMEILYDDKCNLCKGTYKFLKALNYNEAFNFLPLSNSQATLNKLKIDTNLAYKEMYAFIGTKVYKGFDLYLKAATLNLLFWPLLPLLGVAKITNLGQICYKYISERRLKILKGCNVSIVEESREPKFKQQYFLKSLIYMAYLCLIVLFLVFKTPFANARSIFSAKIPGKLLTTLYLVGLDSPNVFNQQDLRMGDKWVEIFFENDGNWKRAPLVGEDGQRINYKNSNKLLLSNHNSDFLYFRTTLPFRRELNCRIKLEEVLRFLESPSVLDNIRRRIKYDYRMNKFEGNKKYRVEYYEKPFYLNEITNLKEKKYEKKLQKSWEFIYNGSELQPIK